MSLFTTFWGALYLAVLIVLMGPSLLVASKRWLAAYMVLLFVMDRAAVAYLPPDLALFFLAFAYFLIAVAVAVTHAGRGAVLVAVTMILTSTAFIGGGFEFLSWDVTGSLQEGLGLIAMLAIIGGRHNGTRVNSVAHGRAVRGERSVSGGTHARQETRK